MRLGFVIQHTVAHIPTADGGRVNVVTNFAGKTGKIGKTATWCAGQQLTAGLRGLLQSAQGFRSSLP